MERSDKQSMRKQNKNTNNYAADWSRFGNIASMMN